MHREPQVSVVVVDEQMRYGLGRKPVQKQADRHKSGQTCRGHPSDSDQIGIAYRAAVSCPESLLLSPKLVVLELRLWCSCQWIWICLFPYSCPWGPVVVEAEDEVEPIGCEVTLALGCKREAMPALR